MSVGILCDWVWKGYCVTNRKRGTKLHEEKSIQGSIALHIANLCRILIFRNVLWISDAEHGISMLDKYQNVGWKKFYLIYGMCDETFSVNCTTEVPEGVDKGWFIFFVTLLNQIYWVGGATAGALLGYVIHFNMKGLEFVMTASCLSTSGMTMTTTQGILTIAAVVLGTMVTRFLPFLIFPEGKEPPEFLAIVFIVLLHRWKKNILLSIGGGTVFYMLLVQFVFCK